MMTERVLPDVEVRLDLRVETLMGALALAVPRPATAGWLDHPLRSRARQRWRHLRNHDAPRLGRILLAQNFWIDDLCCLVGALVEAQDSRLAARFPENELDPVPAIAACDRLAAALVDFADRAETGGILALGEDIPGETVRAIGGIDTIGEWVRRARRVFGDGPEIVRIFPSPLCAPHLAFGPTVITARGPEAWVVFGPVWDFRDPPWKLCGFRSPKLGVVIRHELGHAHLNPHTHAAAQLVGQYASLYRLMAPAVRRLGYSSWEVCLNELILRAAEVRFTAEHEGQAAAWRRLLREESKGFSLIRQAIKAFDSLDGAPVCQALPAFMRALERMANEAAP